MKAMIVFLASACVFAGAASAIANHHEGKGENDWEAKVEQRFEKVDANRDGNVSRDEFLAYKAAEAEKAWEEHAAAAGEDGLVSLEEAKAMHAARMEKHKDMSEDHHDH